MANLPTDSAQGRKQKPNRARKKSTKIDMTAMVDVAFLLLTFFVLTATINQMNLMELAAPPKCEHPEDCYKPISQDKILTILLEGDDQIKYYHGIENPEVKASSYSAAGIRQVLLDHLHRSGPLCTQVNKTKECWDPIFVVKPNGSSRYKNLVDVLDELNIVQAPKYTIAPYTPADSLLLAASVVPL